MSFQAMSISLQINLPATKKCLLLVMANYVNDQNKFWPSYETLAKQAGLSRRSVINYVSEFSKSGIIRKSTRSLNGRNTSNEYLFTPFDYFKRTNQELTINEKGFALSSSESPAPGSESPAPGSESPAPNTFIDTIKDTKEIEIETMSGKPDDAPIDHPSDSSLSHDNMPAPPDSGITELFDNVPPETRSSPEPAASKKSQRKQEAIWVIDYLNAKTGKRFKPTPANIRLVDARLDDYSQREVARVIARKVDEWSHDSKMRQYLRPATLFAATNFESYYGEIDQPLPKETDNGTPGRQPTATNRTDTNGFIRRTESVIYDRGTHVPF